MEIFKSRRFWSGIVGLVFMALVAFVPTLAEHVELLSTAAVIVIGLLIGGYSVEDAVQAWKAPDKQ
jgi:hypothetical protein